jgi:hypothetical protein
VAQGRRGKPEESMLTIPRRTMTLALPAVALALTACGGSSSSDKDKITSLIKDVAANPSHICTSATPQLLAQLGGAAGCQQVTAAVKTTSTPTIKSVTVNGSTATATVGTSGTSTASFQKVNGTWKIASVPNPG